MEVIVLVAVPDYRHIWRRRAHLIMRAKRTNHSDKALENIHPKDRPWTGHPVNRVFEEDLGFLEGMLGKLTGLFDFGHLLSLQLSLLLKDPKVCSILNLVNTEERK